MSPLQIPLVEQILNANAWLVTGSPILTSIDVDSDHQSDDEEFLTFTWEQDGHVESEAFTLEELKFATVNGNDIAVRRQSGEELTINLFTMTPIAPTQEYKASLEQIKREMAYATYTFDAIDSTEAINYFTTRYAVGGYLNLQNGKRMILDALITAEDQNPGRKDGRPRLTSISALAVDIDNTKVTDAEGNEIAERDQLTDLLRESINELMQKERILKDITSQFLAKL